MSLKTKILGLFKYDPDKDGASTFNIKQALKDHGIGYRGQEDRERRQPDCL